jgi:4-amino-4-deoxy-L-arabinose transferase-like glycosyltransferase
LIGTTLFGRRTGALAGLLAALSPPLLVYMLPPMTEALAIFLTLLATWLLIRRLERPRIGDFLTAGAALGLGYLTHPTRAVFAAVLVIGIFIASRHRHTLLRPLGALVVGMALFVAPISLYSLATRGSLSYSGQTYMYAVADDREVGLYVPDQPLPEPTQFVLANREVVVGEIVSNIRRYAGLIFLDAKWLLWLLPAWPLAAFAALRGWYRRLTWPVLLLAAANFSVAASTWATYQPRYQLMTLLLLLPFGIDGLTRLGLARPGLRLGFRITPLHAVVLGIGLFWFRTFADEYRGTFSYAGDPVHSRSDYGMRWTGPHSWVNDRSLAEMTEWINRYTERQDVLAHHAPWVSTFFTERPSTRLPRRLDAESLKNFLVEYRVSYVLLNSDDYRRRYLDDLRTLEAHGVRSLSVGRHPVFDTRPLWREASG